MSGKRPHPHGHGEQSPAKKTRIDDSDRAELELEPEPEPQRSHQNEDRSSDESGALTVLSTHSAAQSAITSPSPSPAATKMATNPATDPDAFEDYYWGLRGNPRLLARSSSEPWTLPRSKEEVGYDGNLAVIRKSMSVVGRHHPLHMKLDQGLRQNIRQVLASMQPCRWISVDYVRLGYNCQVEANPIIAWVTIEENQVPLVEAQRIVDAMAQECQR
jgi:hypothetical protein